MNKKIKNSIDKINPAPDAEQRMYKNIMSKMQEEHTAARKRAGLIKTLKIALPAAACLCIAVIVISHTGLPGIPSDPVTSDYSGVEAANPFSEVSSAEEFKKIGIAIDAPINSENIHYAIIDQSIASICFDKNGHNYTFRASEQSGDFSGICGDEISREQLNSKSNAVLITQKGDKSDYIKIYWTDGRVNYYLSNTDGSDAEALKALALELIK